MVYGKVELHDALYGEAAIVIIAFLVVNKLAFFNIRVNSKYVHFRLRCEW